MFLSVNEIIFLWCFGDFFVLFCFVSVLKDLCYLTIPDQNATYLREQRSNIMPLLGPQPSSSTHMGSPHSFINRILSHEPGRKEFCIWNSCATPCVVFSSPLSPIPLGVYFPILFFFVLYFHMFLMTTHLGTQAHIVPRR